jgi:hypothetical protein
MQSDEDSVALARKTCPNRLPKAGGRPWQESIIRLKADLSARWGHKCPLYTEGVFERATNNHSATEKSCFPFASVLTSFSSQLSK